MDIEDRTAFMHLLEDLSKRREKINKLKQTLIEIKEIAEKHQATAHCCYLEDMTEILQKISECEGSDELTK
jgi:hypothetical protein